VQLADIQNKPLFLTTFFGDVRDSLIFVGSSVLWWPEMSH
jgi:hypothetical protein